MNFKLKLISILLSLFIIFSPGLAFADDPMPPTPPSPPTLPPPPPQPPSAPTPPASPAPIQVQPQTTSSFPDSTHNTQATSTPQSSPAQQTSSSSPNTQSSSSAPTPASSAPTTITTGNATNSTTSISAENTNLASHSQDPLANSSVSSSGAVSNSGRGSSSTNTASSNSTSSTSSTSTVAASQANSATIAGSAVLATNTGNNISSKNVGESAISTGDANTSATSVTAINTNIDPLSIFEFNVADDHNGDIVLNLTPNNSSSTNTFQNNTASLGNTLTLSSNSGKNAASQNTGGNSSIATGNANTQGSALTFANNNIAGNVVYAVVNIFGNLVGDIILPAGSLSAPGCMTCSGGSSVSNSGNGSSSANTASASQNSTQNTFQNNNATIENNLLLNASTGTNDSSKNTGGDSSVLTGASSTQANVLNITNSNISGGNIWLVLVNNAGQWIGQILGAPQGSNMAGSPEMVFHIDPVTGAVTASNSGNGSSSTNNSSLSQSNSSTLTQNNSLNLVNNLNLSANTGGNIASMNTGGDSTIKTGNAKVIANIVNFVNNNIAGSGKLFVTLVNIFGSWKGDFVAPGTSKPQDPKVTQSSSEASGGITSSNINQQSQSLSIVQPFQQKGILGAITPTVNSFGNSVSINDSSQALLVAGFKSSSDIISRLDSPVNLSNEEKRGKIIHINLAILLLLLPFAAGAIIIKNKAMVWRRSQ